MPLSLRRGDDHLRRALATLAESRRSGISSQPARKRPNRGILTLTTARGQNLDTIDGSKSRPEAWAIGTGVRLLDSWTGGGGVPSPDSASPLDGDFGCRADELMCCAASCTGCRFMACRGCLCAAQQQPMQQPAEPTPVSQATRSAPASKTQLQNIRPADRRCRPRPSRCTQVRGCAAATSRTNSNVRDGEPARRIGSCNENALLRAVQRRSVAAMRPAQFQDSSRCEPI